jgi:hypothetical protein
MAQNCRSRKVVDEERHKGVGLGLRVQDSDVSAGVPDVEEGDADVGALDRQPTKGCT